MLPKNIVFVRHGESEGNIVFKFLLNNDYTILTKDFRERHECYYRLTDEGVRQADAVNEFFEKNFGDMKFDIGYVSDFVRAKETAAHIKFHDKWKIASILTERDWGYLKDMTPKEIEEKYPNETKNRKDNPLDWRPPNGESLRDLILRIRQLMDILHRNHEKNSVIIVCHGEFMSGGRIILEEMSQEEFKILYSSKDDHDIIHNGQILHYTRINPYTKQETKNIQWVRSICPWDLSKSSNEWQEINRSKIYSSKDLMEKVEIYPKLF